MALLIGEKVEDAHPLRLLQEYSNADKHRAIRVAVARTTSSRQNEPFLAQDRGFKELQVGDLVGRTTWGKIVVMDCRTAAFVERPEPFSAPPIAREGALRPPPVCFPVGHPCSCYRARAAAFASAKCGSLR